MTVLNHAVQADHFTRQVKPDDLLIPLRSHRIGLDGAAAGHAAPAVWSGAGNNALQFVGIPHAMGQAQVMQVAATARRLDGVQGDDV